MNKTDEQSTTEILLYCPIIVHYVPNISEFDFWLLDEDHANDLFESGRMESGHGAWLDVMKNILPKSQQCLSGIEVDGIKYDSAREVITDYGVDIEIHDNRAWLAIKYTVNGDIDPALLKEYATEQLLALDLETSDIRGMDVNGGFLMIATMPADFCYFQPGYNIENNHLRFTQELPGRKEIVKEKRMTSVIAAIREAEAAKSQKKYDRPNKGIRKKSGHDL